MPWKGEDRFWNSNAGSDLYSDPSDAAALKTQNYIDIYHVPTQNSIAFKSFLTDLSETYELNYQEVGEGVQNYKIFNKTIRRISLGFKVLAASEEEAKENMRRLSELAKMTLGAKDDKDNVAKNNLFRIRFANYILDSAVGGKDGPNGFNVADFSGIYAYVENIQVNPIIEEGAFDKVEGVFFKAFQVSMAIVTSDYAYGSISGLPDFGKKNYEGSSKQFSLFPYGYRGVNTKGDRSSIRTNSKRGDKPDPATNDDVSDTRIEAKESSVGGTSQTPGAERSLREQVEISRNQVTNEDLERFMNSDISF